MKPKANDTQRQAVKAEMLDHVEALCAAWEQLERQSKEMGRGFPSGGEGGSGDGGSLVERVAGVVCHGCEQSKKDPTKCGCPPPAVDPATAAAEWLSDFDEVRAGLKGLYGKLPRLLPLDPESVERGRVNSVDVCTHCGQPAPQVRRIHGAPYCANTCYHSVRRSMAS